MATSREVSLGVGLGTAALVWAIYDGHLPKIAESRISQPNDPDLSGSERQAAWVSAVFVGGIAFIAKDATVLVIGGVALVALSWAHRYANAHDSSVAGAVLPQQAQMQVSAESPYVPS